MDLPESFIVIQTITSLKDPCVSSTQVLDLGEVLTTDPVAYKVLQEARKWSIILLVVRRLVDILEEKAAHKGGDKWLVDSDLTIPSV